MLELINNKKFYNKLVMNTVNSVYKYSKEVFASEVLKVYHKALESKKSSN